MKIKPCILLFLLGIIVGFVLQPIVIKPQAALGGAAIPPFSRIDTAERQALAESFNIAAEKLERGDERLVVDEYLRTAIASQPGSGQWAEEIDKIVQSARSPDAAVYARNLRAIAKVLNTVLPSKAGI